MHWIEEKQLLVIGVSAVVPGLIANAIWPGLNYDLIAAAVGGMAGWWATSAFIERHAARLADQTRCVRCGYSRDGIEGAVCPECGTPWHARIEDARH